MVQQEGFKQVFVVEEDTCKLVKQIQTGECKVDVISNLPSTVEYIYEEPIGKGGGGRIYLVKYSGTRYALKISHEDDDSQVKVECEVLPYLCHPNIITCAAVDTDSRSFLMQFADRNTLAQFISAMHEKYPELLDLLMSGLYVRLLVLLAQVAKGLQYLHSQRCVHRDLNPRNVLLCSKEGYKLGYMAALSDFGACYMEGNQISAVNSVRQLGTPQYAAPEQLTMQSVEEIVYQSDIYSYGVLVWTAISGQEPWDQLKNAQEVFGYVVGQQQTLKIDPRWPTAIKEILTGCFSRDPMQRPGWDRIMELLKQENQQIAKIKALPEDQQRYYLQQLLTPVKMEKQKSLEKQKSTKNLRQESFTSNQSSQGSTESCEPQPSPFAAEISFERDHNSEDITIQKQMSLSFAQLNTQSRRTQHSDSANETVLDQSFKQSSSLQHQLEVDNNKENICCQNKIEKGCQDQEGDEKSQQKHKCMDSTAVGIPVPAQHEHTQCNLKKLLQQQSDCWSKKRQQQQQQQQQVSRSEWWKNFVSKLVSSGVEGLSSSSRELLEGTAATTSKVVDIENGVGSVQELQQIIEQRRGWGYVSLGCKIAWYTILGSCAVVLSVFLILCLIV